MWFSRAKEVLDMDRHGFEEKYTGELMSCCISALIDG
jgi:hypothetical protein